LKVLSRGYAMAQQEDGSVITSVLQVTVGETIGISVTDGQIQACVTGGKEYSHE